MNYISSISDCEREKIKNSRVCIAGCGGLGGYIAEYLIRLGVGHIVAVDGDCFDTSNLNRQVLCTAETIGKSKAFEVKNRAALINPDVDVIAVNEYVTEENAERIIAGCDLVIDAFDSFDARKIMHRACSKLGINMLFGAIGAWKLQVGLLTPESTVLSDVPVPPEYHGDSVLSFVPAACAALQVSEAVKLLSGNKSEFVGKLLDIDLMTNEALQIEL